MNMFIKSGSASLLLGNGYYGTYISPKENKLLKITHISTQHNEFKLLPYVREIDEYEKYYCIPDDLSLKLKPGDIFYNYIKEILKDKNISLFKKNITLHCNFIENAGNYELLDTINDLFDDDYSFWTSYADIQQFTKHILQAISFLHKKKICHLDIKPENIIVNKDMFMFKIIDFGFASMEPFDDFVNDIKGTPGYFPSHNNNYIITEFFPKINAKDVIQTYDKVPIITNRKLIYKVDSYCFGRTLFCLTKSFEINKRMGCFSCDRKDIKTRRKLYKICNSLLINNPSKRLTIQKCLDIYYKKLN